MAISDSDISGVLAAYLERYPEEAGQMSEPLRLLAQGRDFASRRSLPMHVTVGALLVRDDTEILLSSTSRTGFPCSLAATWSRPTPR